MNLKADLSNPQTAVSNTIQNVLKFNCEGLLFRNEIQKLLASKETYAVKDIEIYDELEVELFETILRLILTEELQKVVTDSDDKAVALL